MRKATSIMMAILAVFFVGFRPAQAAFPSQLWGANIYQITDHSIEVGPALYDDNWLDAIGWRVFYDNQLTDWLSIEQFSWQHQGLAENSQHSYQVQFIDSEGNLSESSPAVSRYTKLLPPTRFNFRADKNKISISVPRFVNDQEGLSAYQFDNMTLDRSSGVIERNSWTDYNLQPNTIYTYRVQFQNAEGFATAPLIFSLRTRPQVSWFNLSHRP